MREIAFGAALGYINILLAMVTGLVLTPFIIDALGDSQFGVYTLVGSLIAALSVLDFGINNAVVRFVAKYRAENDQAGEARFLFFALVIYLGISGVLLALGAFVYPMISVWFGESLTPAEVKVAETLFLILLANIMFVVPGGTFLAICTAYEKFVFPRVILVIKHGLRVGLILAILSGGGKAVELALIDTALNVAMILANAGYVIFKLKVRMHPSCLGTALWRAVFAYSFWTFLFALVGKLQWNAGQLVLGAAEGPEAVGIYGIGIMLGTFYAAFGGAIASMLLPGATRMVVEQISARKQTEKMIEIGRANLHMLLPILIGFTLYGREFIALWVGPAYDQAYFVALIVMIVYTLPLAQAFANALLEAHALFAFKAVAYICLISLGLWVGALTLPRFGLIGLSAFVAAGWLLGQLAVNIYFSRKLELGIGLFFSRMVIGFAPFSIVALAAGVAINMIDLEGWHGLAVKVALQAIVYLLLFVTIGLNSKEVLALKGLVTRGIGHD